MNKNINPFVSEYLKITIPVTDEGIALLKERNPEALQCYYEQLENQSAVCVVCDMDIAFNIAMNETYFMFNVTTYYSDEDAPMDGTGEYLDLDNETAEFFKAKAIETIKQNIHLMKKCRCDYKTETA